MGELRLTWYNGIDTDKTVEIANYMKDHAEAGETIFYDIYTAEEKAVDPAKEDTGLFFFKGDPGARFAVCNAGGGYTNWSFLQAGCVDEISLVIAPLADGSTTSVSIFERADYLPKKAPIALSLKEIKKVDGNGVWMRYEIAKS